MLDIKKLLGSFLLSLCRITKKSYTNGLIIVSAFTISVILLGVNGFGYSSIDKDSSYNNTYEDDGDVVENEEELLLTTEAEEAFSQIDHDTFSMQVTDIKSSINIVLKGVSVAEDAIEESVTEKFTEEALVEEALVEEALAEEMLAEETSNEDQVVDAESLIKDEVIEKELVTSGYTALELSDKDYDALIRIVEAEATSEDIIGKIMVANVVINRVNSNRFPNSAFGVIHQTLNNRAQFSPIDDGRYYTVSITDTTIEAVDRALAGEDYSNGALFFVARSLASDKAVSWFDKNLDKVAEHGCHEFFNYY